jgi:hypothetical protein
MTLLRTTYDAHALLDTPDAPWKDCIWKALIRTAQWLIYISR